MFKKDFLAVFATIMLILPGTIAYAHGKNRDAAAFFFLKKAAIDLPQVIEGVEKEKNGRVISFKIEQKEDHPIQYEMKILKDSKVFEAIVDPRSGKVLKTESRGLFSHFSDDLKNVPSTTKLSLKDAISIVESHYGGEALRGNFQRNSITKMFRIRMANNEGAFTVMVDADSGELFRISRTEDGGYHDEEDEE